MGRGSWISPGPRDAGMGGITGGRVSNTEETVWNTWRGSSPRLKPSCLITACFQNNIVSGRECQKTYLRKQTAVPTFQVPVGSWGVGQVRTLSLQGEELLHTTLTSEDHDLAEYSCGLAF